MRWTGKEWAAGGSCAPRFWCVLPSFPSEAQKVLCGHQGSRLRMELINQECHTRQIIHTACISGMPPPGGDAIVDVGGVQTKQWFHQE